MAEEEDKIQSGLLNNAFLQSFVFPSGPGVNLKMREKIALAQMMQKRAYPKTFGEGLSAIGDALGDRRTAIDLERQDRLAQDAAAGLGQPPSDPNAAVAPRAYAPDENEEPIVATPPPAPRSMVAPPPPEPIPPPNGQPGNTGATTFPPPYQPPPEPQPPPGPQSGPGTLPPTGPGSFNDRFGTGAAADPLDVLRRAFGGSSGPQSALEPPPGTPVMAFGGEPSEDVPAPANPRDLAALALMRNQTAGGPQPNPTMTAAPGGPPADPALALAGTDQGIRPAPPPPPGVRVAQAGPPQPGAIPGYVPPERADPAGAPIIGPGRREMELRAILRQHQGNPYAAQSPAAIELQQLEALRAQRQNEANEIFKANIARTTKREELREQARIDQDKRILESQQSRITIGDLPSKLQQEGEKRLLELQKGRQELITPAAEAPSDPRLGTPQSPQRTGVPTTPPVPPGVSPQKWSELHAPEHQKALVAVESATPDFNKMLDVIKLARDHPGKYWGTGLTSYITPRGSDQYDFSAVVDQLKGKNFLAGYQKLKGGGAVSEIEGSKTEQSQARLDRASSEAAFNAGLDDLEKNIRSDLEQIQRKINQPVTAWQRRNEDPPAPDKGEVVSGFKDGKTRVYLGGDPTDIKGSWRIVR